MMVRSLMIGNHRWQCQIYGRRQKSQKAWSLKRVRPLGKEFVPGNKIPGDGLANAAHAFANRGIRVLRTRRLLFGPQMRNIPITHVRTFSHRNKLRCLVSRQTRANLSENIMHRFWLSYSETYNFRRHNRETR